MDSYHRLSVNGVCTVMVLAENYIDTATPEEILTNAFHLATRITNPSQNPKRNILPKLESGSVPIWENLMIFERYDTVSYPSCFIKRW